MKSSLLHLFVKFRCQILLKLDLSGGEEINLVHSILILTPIIFTDVQNSYFKSSCLCTSRLNYLFEKIIGDVHNAYMCYVMYLL